MVKYFIIRRPFIMAREKKPVHYLPFHGNISCLVSLLFCFHFLFSLKYDKEKLPS